MLSAPFSNATLIVSGSVALPKPATGKTKMNTTIMMQNNLN
jgi:hypothetical protein